MEVHHHPDLHHRKKNFKEYFLEFLMIFLAVTLGFLAENLREHITDRAKEKEYIAGFVHNVCDDTADLRHVIDFNTKQISGIDSMLRLSHADLISDSNRKLFYYLVMRYFYNSSVFRSNDATLQQLKSTGDYRLIKKDNVADSLTKYDADVKEIYSESNFYEAYFKEILSRLDDLTDMTIFGDTSLVKKGKISNKPFPGIRDNGDKLPTFFNKVFVFRIITNAYVENYLMPQLEDAIRLILYLKKEYHSSEE